MREKTHSHLLILDDAYKKRKKKRVKIIKWPTNLKEGIGVCSVLTTAFHPHGQEEEKTFFNYKNLREVNYKEGPL